MQPRMRNPVSVFPDAMKALFALHAVCEKSGVPARTLGLVHLRASQINGCSVCVDLHVQMRQPEGETTERLLAVSAWRDAPYFDAAERAALALTEAVTRLSDRSDPVPDDIWQDATKHFDEAGLSGLLLAIASVNVWNRLNVPTRQVAGRIDREALAKVNAHGSAA